jgi:hypothetical protein
LFSPLFSDVSGEQILDPGKKTVFAGEVVLLGCFPPVDINCIGEKRKVCVKRICCEINFVEIGRASCRERVLAMV